MTKIRVLDEQTINQIAAGEVVESSASVVKELVENALDAKATSIIIEISGGGLNTIRIQDDGIGMGQDDVLLCLERHATSKIRSIDDLSLLVTMGFRGEALSSIASISHLSILTAPRSEMSQNKRPDEEQLPGTSLTSSGGKITSCVPTNCFGGTTIEVKSLFYNVPARRKFQKSPERESQEIVRLISQIALANPEVGFELICNKKTVFTLTPVSKDTYKVRIEELLGREYSENLLLVEYAIKGIRIWGFTGKHTYTRQNRLQQYLFINQRPIVASLVSYAIKEGYGTAIEGARFPVCILHFEMPQDQVDVNVHPQKREVRFRVEDDIRRACVACVSSALFPSCRSITLPSEYVANQKISSISPAPIENKFEFKGFPAFAFANKKAYPQENFNEIMHSKNSISCPAVDMVQTELALNVELRPIGLFREFIIVDWPTNPALLNKFGLDKTTDGLIMINAKHATARIMYEHLLHKRSSQFSQALLVPLFIELSCAEAFCLNGILPSLNEIGFSIREFGKSSFLIEAYPTALEGVSFEEFIHKIVKNGDLEAYQDPSQALRKIANIALLCSCHAIPKNMEEALYLLRSLSKCDEATTCPSGGALLCTFSLNEIQNKFTM
jgi:DNA mismatch repair protein MutL